MDTLRVNMVTRYGNVNDARHELIRVFNDAQVHRKISNTMDLSRVLRPFGYKPSLAALQRLLTTYGSGRGGRFEFDHIAFAQMVFPSVSRTDARAQGRRRVRQQRPQTSYTQSSYGGSSFAHSTGRSHYDDWVQTVRPAMQQQSLRDDRASSQQNGSDIALARVTAAVRTPYVSRYKQQTRRDRRRAAAARPDTAPVATSSSLSSSSAPTAAGGRRSNRSNYSDADRSTPSPSSSSSPATSLSHTIRPYAHAGTVLNRSHHSDGVVYPGGGDCRQADNTNFVPAPPPAPLCPTLKTAATLKRGDDGAERADQHRQARDVWEKHTGYVRGHYSLLLDRFEVFPSYGRGFHYVPPPPSVNVVALSSTMHDSYRPRVANACARGVEESGGTHHAHFKYGFFAVPPATANGVTRARVTATLSKAL